MSERYIVRIEHPDEPTCRVYDTLQEGEPCVFLGTADQCDAWVQDMSREKRDHHTATVDGAEAFEKWRGR